MKTEDQIRKELAYSKEFLNSNMGFLQAAVNERNFTAILETADAISYVATKIKTLETILEQS